MKGMLPAQQCGLVYVSAVEAGQIRPNEKVLQGAFDLGKKLAAE